MSEYKKLLQAKNLMGSIRKSFFYLSFTGGLLEGENIEYILKLMDDVNILVVSPCAIWQEIEQYCPNVQDIEKRLAMSDFLYYLGGMINNGRSFLHKAFKKKIPVFCPIIEGDFAFYLIENKFKLNIVSDIKKINFSGVFQDKTSAIVMGTGMVKHHVLNANLFSDGLDYSILINSSVEYDGSDSGARPEEAVSWGKVGVNKECIKISCCPSLVLRQLLEK